MSILQVKGLDKSFGTIQAVHGLNLEVNKSDLYGVLGPNGAGKSTTIRMILGLIKPDRGVIHLFTQKMPENRIEVLRKVGALIERPDFYEYLTALKNLELLSKYTGKLKPKAELMDLLDWVGLAERATSKVKTFSQGMKQRLGIAQALLNDPEILFLDEPSNGLDPQGQKDLRTLLTALNKDREITIVLSSHLLHEVEIICNRMVIINKGKAIVEGSVEELLMKGSLPVKLQTAQTDEVKKMMSIHLPAYKLLSETDNELMIKMPANEVWKFNELLVSQGIRVNGLQVAQNLEDYFLQLT